MPPKRARIHQGGALAPPAAGAEALRTSTVLVVEDDETVRGFVASALAVCGYAVLTAANGAEALANLETLRRAGRAAPSAIVTDVNMPELDGLAFLRAYRAWPGPHAPALVLSGSPDARDEALDLGAAAALAKPVDVDALLTAVAALVGGRTGGQIVADTHRAAA